MSARDDMKAALEGRQPAGAVPLWELEFHLWDQFSGRHVILGPEFEQLSAAEQEKALHTNAEIMLSVSAELGFTALKTPGGYWHVGPGQLAYFVLPGQTYWEQLRVVKEMAPPDLVLVGGTGGVLCPGYGEFAYRLYDDPDGVEEDAKREVASARELGRKLVDYGVEVAVSASDIADNHGPYFTPPQMKRFILPYMAQWGEAMRELGLYSILHTDGQIMPILDQIADTGISAVQALDPIAGVDIAEAKRVAGNRLALCGNIDCGLLHLGPREKVYEVTRDTLRTCKPGGGFVLGASNAVFQETPPEHYRAMIQAWRDFGAYE